MRSNVTHSDMTQVRNHCHIEKRISWGGGRCHSREAVRETFLKGFKQELWKCKDPWTRHGEGWGLESACALPELKGTQSRIRQGAKVKAQMAQGSLGLYPGDGAVV